MANAAIEKPVFGGPWSIVALVVLGCGFLAVWLLGLNQPSRHDLEGLLHVSFALNTSLDAWTLQGRQTALKETSVAEVGDIRCQGSSARRMPTIHYVCIYDLRGMAGEKYRLFLGADHNLGWRRIGMADFGNYRLVDIPVERQKAMLADEAT